MVEVVLLVAQMTMASFVEMILVNTLLEIVLFIGALMAIQVEVVIGKILRIMKRRVRILENAPIY